MAGMKRFIAYIYGYENAKKAGNTGFARIELRGEECRLEIHLRSVYAAQTHCRVYLFRKQADYEKNPKSYQIIHKTVKKGDVLKIKEARGGGFAISLLAK